MFHGLIVTRGVCLRNTWMEKVASKLCSGFDHLGIFRWSDHISVELFLRALPHGVEGGLGGDAGDDAAVDEVLGGGYGVVN